MNLLWEETQIKNLRTLLAAETWAGKYVNAPQLKTCDDFSKLAWRRRVRNLLRDSSFQHLEPVILNTSHPFTPHGGCQCGMEVRPEITKLGPSAAEVRRSLLAETLKARFLADMNHCGPPQKSHTEALLLYTHWTSGPQPVGRDIMCLMLHVFLNSCFEGLLPASHETVCPCWKLWKGLIVHKWFKTLVFAGHKGMLKDIPNVVSRFLANLSANQVGKQEIMSSPRQLRASQCLSIQEFSSVILTRSGDFNLAQLCAGVWQTLDGFCYVNICDLSL